MPQSLRRRVKLTGAAAEAAAEQLAKRLDGYMSQIGNIAQVNNQAIDLCLNAELRYSGVPKSEVEQEEMLERCVAMGKKIGLERMRRYNLDMKEMMELLDVADLPAFIHWAAKKAGNVDLPSTELELTPDELAKQADGEKAPSKLITSTH